MHAGPFRVSVIHRTLTWTTGYLTYVRDHSLCVRIHTGLGTPTASQHIFGSEKLTIFSCATDGIQTSGLWLLSLMLYYLSQPVTPATMSNSYQFILVKIVIIMMARLQLQKIRRQFGLNFDCQCLAWTISKTGQSPHSFVTKFI